LYRTAIKAKQKACRFELCAFVFYQKPPMAAKRRSQRLPKDSFLPPENIWDLLRKTQEKRAQMRSNFPKSSFLVEFYNSARTYFEEKC
jgi:hypothetical protein